MVVELWLLKAKSILPGWSMRLLVLSVSFMFPKNQKTKVLALDQKYWPEHFFYKERSNF